MHLTVISFRLQSASRDTGGNPIEQAQVRRVREDCDQRAAVFVCYLSLSLLPLVFMLIYDQAQTSLEQSEVKPLIPCFADRRGQCSASGGIDRN